LERVARRLGEVARSLDGVGLERPPPAG